MDGDFAKLIKTLMRAAGSDRKLAARAGVGASTLNDWAAGKPPSLQYIKRAAANLELTPAQFLCFEPLPYRFVERFAAGRRLEDRDTALLAISQELARVTQRQQELQAELARLAAPPVFDKEAAEQVAS